MPLENGGEVTWLMVGCGTFSLEKILITHIPGPSLSLWVISKCLFCHSMVIQALNDPRMNEMMLEWPFSHTLMMTSDWSEGQMMKFLNQGKCPRIFSSSLCPHFNHILSSDTHSITEMSAEWLSIIPHSVPSFSVISISFNGRMKLEWGKLSFLNFETRGSATRELAF